MKIVCDNCTTKYSIADEKVRGKVFKIKCKKCSHIIVVKGEPTTGEGQPAGFDQKETRVFDYSGFEGQRGAAGGEAAGSPAADPIWHLVIDREQVGPLTVAELITKWDGGEIDRETYAWREGFADWQRLGAIDELSQVVRRGGAPARGDAASSADDRASLFGDATSTPAAGSPMPTRSDLADLFAGAGTSTEDEVPSDLFGGSDRAASPGPSVFASSAAPSASSSSRRSAPKEDLFGGSSDVDMSHGDNGGHDVRPMTGQRNENSVLFSLNNLSALAGGGGADMPSPRSSGGGGGGGGLSSFGSAGSSGAEGSGLIDIRAMAQMTMGASRRDEGPRSRRASEDDLPVFSASSFSAPAAGVLMPTVQPQNNRLMVILMAALTFLGVAAIILLAVIIFGGKGSSTADPAIASSGSEPIATAPSPSPSPTTPPPSTTTPPRTEPTRPPVTPPVTTPATTPREERPAPTPPRTEPPRRPTTTPPPVTTPRAPVETRPTPAPEPPTRPAPTEPPVPKAQKCDEVACLVTPDLPCCPKRGSTTPRPSSSDSGLPDKLEQSDIISGMKAVNGRVMACNDRHRVPGAFKVKVTVSPDGNVTNAGASPPIGGTAAAGCVENAVRGARFKKTKNSITFNYPYTFR